MTTFPTRIAATDAGRPPRSPGRPASAWAFTGLAVTSFGGPLALAALWLSQLIVFAVYPRFARRHQDRRVPAWALTVVATAFALYGLWVTIQHSAT